MFLSTVSWSSAVGGSWNTPGNWSTGVVPTSADTVFVNQPGNIQISLSGNVSVSSLSLSGDNLQITGGSLSISGASSIGASSTLALSTATVALAAGAMLTNSGAIIVNPGSLLSVGGAYTETSTGSLTLPGATSLGSGVASNLLSNGGFESPSAGGSTTTAPSSWGPWGSSYVSTNFAHTGAQSLEQSGPNSGVQYSFPVTPGVSYTASAYAMTPSTSPLTGPEGAFINILFYDAAGHLISSFSPPNSITALTSQSATGGPILGSIGGQGWNFFTTTAVAPSNAATVTLALQTGAYTGIPGTAGGTVYWDDAQFGPTAAVGASVNAASISSSGAINIGAGDSVTTAGTFVQTSSGVLNVQLGGPPAGLLFGSLTAGGSATLAGTLSATLVNGYSPSVNDGFSLLNYNGETGGFTTYELPSASTYSFSPSVNPTYTGIGAIPAVLSTTVNAATTVGAASADMLGVNLTFWDHQLNTAQTQSLVEAAGLNMFRFPGGLGSDDFHFNLTGNQGDSSSNTITQFAQFIQSVSGTGIVTLDYGSGSPQEAEAELAYLCGSPTDTTTIGTGIEWNDAAGQWQNVNWQTVGYWASLRASAPLAVDDGLNFLRIGQAAPFTGIKYWEVGNEEYSIYEIDHHGTAGPNGSTGAAHDPATYAAFASSFANFIAADQANLPVIQIGIDSEDPTGAEDNNWTRNVLVDGLALNFVPGFISDHSYMQNPGSENDSFLLNDTVSDPASILDWSTRYAAYQALLQSTFGSNASSVQVMATEFNSVAYNPGKQTTSLVNGLFLADSIGSLLDSGYAAGDVWDLRNGWLTTNNNSTSLYGWRQGGDYGLLGDPDFSTLPSTGPYVAYPTYYAEQLASEMVQPGGQAVSATSNYGQLTVYGMIEANGHLDLLVINKNPDASVTEPFTLTGFVPSGQAQVWQYGETQDYAQSQSPTGASSLANASTTVNVTGNNFSYTFAPYSMTVIDLAPAVAPAVSAFQVNDGNPQRSMVNSLTVTFNQPVTLGGGAIVLNQLLTGGGTIPMSFSLNSPNGGTTWVLTFTDPMYIAGSLPNGAYALAITGSAVSNSLGQTMAGTTTESFWRFYGDFLGTGKVDASDFSIFAPLFGLNTTPADWYVDYNGDGKIDASDFSAFAPNFGLQVVIPPAATTLTAASAGLTTTVGATAAVSTVTASPIIPISTSAKKRHHHLTHPLT